MNELERLERMAMPDLIEQEDRWRERADGLADRLTDLDRRIDELHEERVRVSQDCMAAHTRATVLRLASERRRLGVAS